MNDRKVFDGEVFRIVGRASRQWRSAGLSRGRRSRLSAELQDHLIAARNAGLPMSEVVGDDPARFFSEWAEASRPSAVVDVAIWAVGVATLGVGSLALLGLVRGHDAVGFTTDSAGFISPILVFTTVAYAIRRFRQHLSHTGVLISIGLALVAQVFIVVGAISLGERIAKFIEIGAIVAIVLVLIGLTCHYALVRRSS